MLVAKIVWTDAATYWKIHYSHLPLQIFPAPNSKVAILIPSDLKK